MKPKAQDSIVQLIDDYHKEISKRVAALQGTNDKFDFARAKRTDDHKDDEWCKYHFAGRFATNMAEIPFYVENFGDEQVRLFVPSPRTDDDEEDELCHVFTGYRSKAILHMVKVLLWGYANYWGDDWHEEIAECILNGENPLPKKEEEEEKDE